MRFDSRHDDQLRPITITTRYQKYAAGSALIQWGDTWVLCAASIEEKVPPFLQESTRGWVTGEYTMLPASSSGGRKSRKQGGRETEIQRLIGRSLRAAINLDLLGKRTITIDCDVLQADGGTRVASITGGYIALALALDTLQKEGRLAQSPLTDQVAAVSVGIIGERALLDLPYEEDKKADVDMNVVMTSVGSLIEIQGTAEGAPFSRNELSRLCDLAWVGIQKLFSLQHRTLEAQRSSPDRSVTVSL